MSIRVDSASLISGKTVVSLYAGHGIQAQDIPSTGTSGAGYLYNDIAAEGAAATDEMRGELLTLPSSGTLTVNEDSSFSFTDAPDGTYTFDYRGFLNGVTYGDFTVTLEIGDAATNYDIGGTSNVAISASGDTTRATTIGGISNVTITASGDTTRNAPIGGTSTVTITASGDTTYESGSGNYDIGGTSNVTIAASGGTVRATAIGGISSLTPMLSGDTRRATTIGGISSFIVAARADLITGDQPRFGVIRLPLTAVKTIIRVGA